jgi:hypothetical protein
MPSLGPVELFIILFVMAAYSLVLVIPFWMIFTKAGFPGLLSIGILIPVVNIGLLFYLAFAEWPALRREDRALREGTRRQVE